MSPEEALILAVEADPSADLPRLVYADWLDENDREPFADFLRTELELAKLPLDSPAAPPLRERLWQAWAAVDAVWLHRFTQPKMLRAHPTRESGGGERTDDIAALIARMRELEPHTHVYEPAEESLIRELEVAFGRPMPPSYRAFLARFGAISILDNSFSGILDGKIDQGRGWAWTDTKYAREWCQLPSHYLVVEPDSDGFVCLDFSRVRADGECPVVYHMPFRETPFNEMAMSYGEWLRRSLEGYIEAWSDGED